MADQSISLAGKKLIARDGDDLNVISAMMQDAALTPADIGYDTSSRLFALTANRYIAQKAGFFRKAKGFRQRVGLHFNHVAAVRQQGFSADLPALALLAIAAAESDAGVVIRLEFAGDITIELSADSIDAVMTDMGEPWEAIAAPDHH